MRVACGEVRGGSTSGRSLQVQVGEREGVVVI